MSSQAGSHEPQGIHRSGFADRSWLTSGRLRRRSGAHTRTSPDHRAGVILRHDAARPGAERDDAHAMACRTPRRQMVCVAALRPRRAAARRHGTAFQFLWPFWRLDQPQGRGRAVLRTGRRTGARCPHDSLAAFAKTLTGTSMRKPTVKPTPAEVEILGILWD